MQVHSLFRPESMPQSVMPKPATPHSAAPQSSTPKTSAPQTGRRLPRRVLIDRPLFLVVLLAWGVACLGWSLVAGVLRIVLPTARRQATGQAGIRAGFAVLLRLMHLTGLCRFELSALDALDTSQALVIAANHPTLLDAVLVTARLPRTVCISKASLWHNPFLGGGIRLAGYLRNDSPLALVRAGIASLRRGQHLLVFPEGTRTAPDSTLQPFHGGFATMAKAAGVPVQAILIETDNPYLRKDWPLFRMPPLPIAIRIRLGRRFRVDGSAKDFVAALERYFHDELEPRRTLVRAVRPRAPGVREPA